MLYLIGTGIYYLTDIPLRAVNILKECDEIYFERYTNLNDISYKPRLEEEIKKKIIALSREEVESDFLIKRAKEKIVAFLVPGDPLAATTDITLVKECIDAGIKYKVVHASSIFSAISESGLSLYRFGATASIPIYSENFKPESFFDIIEKNISAGLHTLVLLEAKSETEFLEYEGAVKILKSIEDKRDKHIIAWDDVIVLSRIGSEDQRFIKLSNEQVSLKPPVSLVIPANISKNEKEFIDSLY